MLTVGITGGLATGKSLVTRRLQTLGAVTFSADEAARAVLTPQSGLLEQIAARFGADMLLADGRLDRSRLAQRVFDDASARAQLNQIMHPPILRLLRAQIDACRVDLPPTTVVAVEVPLLFETRLEDWFERIVVVTASQSVQVARLCARSGLDEAQARRRVSTQWPLAEKAARADVVLHNDGTIPDLQRSVDGLWQRWHR